MPHSGRLLDTAALVRPGTEACSTTIHFCGAGGTSSGALRGGLRPLVAINHNADVCRVHRINFPTIETQSADLSQTDPERFIRTDVLQTSPACTAHSAAAGARRRQKQVRIKTFAARGRPVLDQPGDNAERSRATMFCVLEHAEAHAYDIVLAENVLDAAKWVNFDLFLEGMRRIGYRQQRLLSVNAAFVGGTPQCRDRLHMAFARDGVPMPNLDLSPPAPCPACDEDVLAVQTWKRPDGGYAGTRYRIGEYDAQYIYTCPACATPVVPYFRSALNAIDPTVPAPTLGEIGRGLSETMRLRIARGIERFGMVPMLLTNNCTTHAGRVRSLLDVAFTQTGSNTTAVLLPPLDAGAAELPDPVWVNAQRPRHASGIRGAVRSRSALIDGDKLALARQFFGGAHAAARDLGAWRYRTLTPRERLLVQGFAADHYVEGDAKAVHLMIGNANPPTVEAELATRVGAALSPSLYPAHVRPVTPRKAPPRARLAVA